MSHTVHPPGCFKCFKSQAMRICRNCTDISDYKIHVEQLIQAYQERGYQRLELRQTTLAVEQLPWETLLAEFVIYLPRHRYSATAYPETFPTFSAGLKLDIPLQTTDQPWIYTPITVTELIAQTALKSQVDAISRQPSPTINSVNNNSLHADCQSNNGVYLITCQDCHLQYICETKRRFIVRLKEHTRDVNNKRDTPSRTISGLITTISSEHASKSGNHQRDCCQQRHWKTQNTTGNIPDYYTEMFNLSPKWSTNCLFPTMALPGRIQNKPNGAYTHYR